MRIKEITECLNSIDFISKIEKIDSSSKPNRGVIFLFKFEMIFQDKKELFNIGFKDNFPLGKPIIFIKSYNQFGFIPHIDPDGYVCFAHDEGLVLDFKNPKGIIEESIKLAVSTLIDGIAGVNRDDFFNEFDNYLRANKHTKTGLLSFLEVSEDVKKICAYEYKNKVLLCESKSKLKRYNLKSLLNYNNEKLRELNPFVYAHIDLPIEPHEFDKKWYKKEFLDIIESSLQKSKKLELNKLMFTLKTTNILLHFQAPNLSDCLIGFNIKEKGLGKSSKAVEIDVYYISRIDSKYINLRGGAFDNLSKKKVLIVGCGSVGGFIAHKLVKSGVVNVTLVDNDKFNLDNINRHVLGINSIGKFKTEALKSFIEISAITTKISVENNKIEKAIETKNVKLKDYDLIISATGNPTVNLWLNDLLVKDYNTPLIVTWVEPYGIGGHSILLNNQNKKGCYRCLMDQKTNHNTAAFYSDNQSFIKSITSCSSVFTPYGVLDAEQSAIGCVKLALSYFLGKENDNPIISWKGDSEVFINNHFNLSERYNLSDEELYKVRYLYKNKRCETCAKL
ncbi:ThiF family adenylyltransferase [Maribacter sp. SA7]|uniref:ThiF family adenylyltransferase n=1 Tax=Maribacter zhoushanensis TaxID=3030012 RepID=UPI0023EE0B2A|nr:ThiF family adenylyltransferase [Maribacter zhoushanensis]MDF4203105.1 ThiF family adenylyltransferase [Maribacter zhoushanensis]